MPWLSKPGQSAIYAMPQTSLPLTPQQGSRRERPALTSEGGEHERFCGRVPERLHGGPLQAGVRRGRRGDWRSAASGEARRQVQVFPARLPPPAEGEGSHLQLAAQIQTEEMDFRRYHGRTDSRYSSHSTRCVNMSAGSKKDFFFFTLESLK